MSSALDQLYAKYSELLALAERSSHNTRIAYHDKADGVMTAIRIIEGASMQVVEGRYWAAKMRALIGEQVEVTLDYEKPVKVRGRLVSFNEYGEVGLRDEEGIITWAWPALDTVRI